MLKPDPDEFGTVGSCVRIILAYNCVPAGNAPGLM